MLVILAIGMLSVLLMWKPFSDPAIHRLFCFNELTFLLAAMHLYLFTDFVIHEKSRYAMGFVLIGLVMFNLLINALFGLWVAGKRLYLFFIKCQNIVTHRLASRNKTKTTALSIDGLP